MTRLGDDAGGNRWAQWRYACYLQECYRGCTGVFSCGWVGASIRTDWRLSESRLVVPVEESSEEVMRASLRNDVAMHPGDFVAFPTETAAMRFMREHSTETSRETQPRMLDLGVMGYWQGRTLVVVPISPVEAR